ncbi:hypothetical protein GCM10011585_32990 [Edaphobacter dinghuensis]|uniref:Uncharacterized protein n=1 Tax=Edaphobacter dinghuensis TaxID=1560005 RepID=A0A917HPL8_9BACT|nr:hypothetical protein GCM10011585_32990 [Edaphobacter dinghuensis]
MNTSWKTDLRLKSAAVAENDFCFSRARIKIVLICQLEIEKADTLLTEDFQKFRPREWFKFGLETTQSRGDLLR